jgi:hypothetical protein
LDKILGYSYSVRNSEVFWGESKISDADPESFEVLEAIWARDAKNVYTYNTKRRGVDIASFQVLNALFAKDKNNVYYLEGKATKIEDPSTFEVLDKGKLEPSLDGYIDKFSYARDSQNIYCYLSGEGKPKRVRGADRNSFRVLRNGFAVDDKKAYCFGRTIKGADVKTFEVISKHHAQDKNSVFYGDIKLEKADTATFKHVLGFISHDKYHVYYQDRLVDGCDPDSIQIFDTDDYFFRDKKHVFVFGEVNELIDADSFEIIGNSIYQKDKNNVYCHGKLLEGADLSTFQILDGATAKDKNSYYRSEFRVQSL